MSKDRRYKGFSKEQVLDAIKGSGGVISAVARNLSCDWVTANKYVKQYPAAVDAIKAEQETMLDEVEVLAYDIARGGDGKMVRYILSTKGKERGWSTESQGTAQASDPVINIVLPDGSKI